MLPTFKEGNEVLTFNWFINLKVGDLVVAKLGGKDIVKRVHKISGRKIYILGDNKNNSTDSQDFGWVDKSAIMGRVIYYGTQKDLTSGR